MKWRLAKEKVLLPASKDIVENCLFVFYGHTICPASLVKKNQAHLLNREPLSWFCVSDLLILI